MTIFKLDSGGRRAGKIALGALCAVAIPASSASAATLQLFAKTTQNTFTDPSGHPIRGHVPPPAAASVLTNTGIEYLGSLKHHADTPSASTNIICFVTKAPMALCYGQIAIGGSMLLANRFTANLAHSNPFDNHADQRRHQQIRRSARHDPYQVRGQRQQPQPNHHLLDLIPTRSPGRRQSP